MQKIEKFLWIILISFIVYDFIPIFAYLMSESAANNYAKICVLFINSIYSLLAGIILTKQDGFKWYYSIVIGILFIPSSILLYNFSTIIFSIVYIVICLVGSLLYYKYSNKKVH